MKHQKKHSTNPGGYTSNGAVLDDGELNSGKLHLTWKVPYQAGTLEVKAYDKNGKVVATDSVSTSSTPYTISAVADNLIENVKYKVEEFTGMEVDKINILCRMYRSR